MAATPEVLDEALHRRQPLPVAEVLDERAVVVGAGPLGPRREVGQVGVDRLARRAPRARRDTRRARTPRRCAGSHRRRRIYDSVIGSAHAALGGDLDGALVAGVGVADHAGARVGGQHALQLRRRRGPVPSARATMPAWIERPMPTPPPWWMRHPRRARRRVDERVEQRPVGDGVGAVGHRLGLAVRRGDRAGVEVVTPDDDRRRQLAAAHHLVEAQPEAVALAVAEPADARRQALEGDALAGEADPAGEALVVGELLQHRSVGRRDVGRVAGQGDPAERSLALAEQRPDVGRQEAWVGERPVEATQLGLGAQAVAVVEDLGALVHEPDHRRAVPGHRLAGATDVAVADRCGPSRPRPRREVDRDVASADRGRSSGR